MKILIGYDGSESADVAMSVTAAHAARFGGPISAMRTDASDVDNRSEQQARQLRSVEPGSPALLASTPAGVHSSEAPPTTSSSTPRVPCWSFRRAQRPKTTRTQSRSRVS
jgi:nucleotide-binding universal stress UspA family protein